MFVYAGYVSAEDITSLVIFTLRCDRTDRRICNWISDGGSVVVFQTPVVPRVRHTGDTRNFFDYPEQNWENWSFRNDEVSDGNERRNGHMTVLWSHDSVMVT